MVIEAKGSTLGRANANVVFPADFDTVVAVEKQLYCPMTMGGVCAPGPNASCPGCRCSSAEAEVSPDSSTAPAASTPAPASTAPPAERACDKAASGQHEMRSGVCNACGFVDVDSLEPVGLPPRHSGASQAAQIPGVEKVIEKQQSKARNQGAEDTDSEPPNYSDDYADEEDAGPVRAGPQSVASAGGNDTDDYDDGEFSVQKAPSDFDDGYGYDEDDFA